MEGFSCKTMGNWSWSRLWKGCKVTKFNSQVCRLLIRKVVKIPSTIHIITNISLRVFLCKANLSLFKKIMEQCWIGMTAMKI